MWKTSSKPGLTSSGSAWYQEVSAWYQVENFDFSLVAGRKIGQQKYWDIEKVESSSAHRTAVDEQSLFCPNMLLPKSMQLHKHIIIIIVSIPY